VIEVVVIAVAAGVFSGLTGLACGWHFGKAEEWHQGKCAERERQLERERRAAVRRLGAPPEIRAKTGPLPRVSSPVVIIPRPGVRIPVIPQAGRDSGAGTVTMPALTDTGWQRALVASVDE
jgi:hypothetical protein